MVLVHHPNNNQIFLPFWLFIGLSLYISNTILLPVQHLHTPPNPKNDSQGILSHLPCPPLFHFSSCCTFKTAPHNLWSLLTSDVGEVSPKLIQSTTDLAGLDINPYNLRFPGFSPAELLVKTFVRTLDDGTSYRATVIQDLDVENHSNIKFLVELSDGKFDEIIAYGTLFIT
jgi:hypothetical protein